MVLSWIVAERRYIVSLSCLAAVLCLPGYKWMGKPLQNLRRAALRCSVPQRSLQELLLTSDASESSLAGRHVGRWAVWGRDCTDFEGQSASKRF